MPVKFRDEPVLIEREQELAELGHHLKLATKGKGTAIFISGEAGTGKTRLITEFLNQAKKLGVNTLTGGCLSNAPVPYFPFFEAFDGFFSGEQSLARDFDLAVWLKGPTQSEQLEKTPVFTPQAWKDQTFAAVAKTLTSISKREPMILIIEDVHWADSASLALIHYIARCIRDEKILVVATYRSEEITADVEGRPHPLVETLRLMRREDLIKEIKVNSLSQRGVFEIAGSMLGGDLQKEFVEKLVGKSQGNPLFVVESLRMLHERDGLFQEDAKWRLARDELGIPNKIKDIILQRLSSLLRSQRKMVDIASVIGGKFSADLLASVLGLDDTEVIEKLDVVGQTTSLLGCEGEQCMVQFDHARTRDVVYEEISPALKRLYHAKVAETLEKMSNITKLPFSELAYHYALGGDNEKAIEYSLAAGEDALARWSNEEAIKHFRFVLKTAGEDLKRIEVVSAFEGLGDAFHANGMFKEATRIFEDLANKEVTDVVRLRAYRKAMDSVDFYGDLPHEMELVKKAEPYAAFDRLENARVLSNKGRCLILQVKASAAKEAYEEALRVLEEEYALWDVAKTLMGVGSYHALFASTASIEKQGFAELLRAFALFNELGDFWWQMQACHALGFDFSLCLHDVESLEFFGKILAINDKMKIGDYLHLCYAKTFMARSLWGTNDFRKALAYSLEALEASEKTDSDVARAMIYGDLVVEYAFLEDLANSEEYFEKLMKLPPKILTHGYVQTSLAKAVFFAVKDQWKESNQIFENLKRFTHTLGYAVRFKLLHAWALEKQGHFEKAQILRQETQKAYSEAGERIAHASVQASLMARRRVLVGEEFEIRFDMMNIGRKKALLVELQNIPLAGFQVTSSPSWCDIEGNSIRLNNKEIGPFQVITVKLALKSLKAGTFAFNPVAVYVNDLDETKTCNMNSVNITASQAQPSVQPGRVSSGLPSLDNLLIGGIPEKYSVILNASSSNERALLIKRFLETAAQANQLAIYLTTESENAETLAKAYPNNFSAIVCGPQADLLSEKLTGIFKLKGVENLTEIDITLKKYFKTLDPSKEGPRVACIQIVSDVLLQHHPTNTRKWLSGLLANLKSEGFTSLVVIDCTMHSLEDTQALLGLFDIEMRVFEKEDNKVLRISKFRNQKYLKNELILTGN